MKGYRIFTRILICFVAIFTFVDGLSQTWQQITDFPGTQRDDGTSFVVGNTAYCGTGNLPWGAGTADFYALDMGDDTWSAIASLPVGEERQYACGFSNADYGFIFGGYHSGIFFNDIWQYNPLTNSWIEKTPLPGAERSASAHFVIGDTAYIVCGKTATNYAINEVWAYNMINDTWLQKSDFPFGNRWRSCGISSSTKGYLLFGKDETLSYPTGLYEYDPQTDSWAMISVFPGVGRSHAKAVFFSDDLIVLTGFDSLMNSYKDMWRYDLAENQWYQLVSIPADERRAGMCFTSSTALYYTAGINSAHQRIKESWKNINPTDLKTASSQTKVLIYPNPAGDFFTIECLGSNESGTILIYDLSGKSVLAIPFENYMHINTTQFDSGLYCIVIRMESEIISQKLVIQN